MALPAPTSHPAAAAPEPRAAEPKAAAPQQAAVAAAPAASRIYGTGEMADLVRAFDWGGTSLGPIAGWPQPLVTCVNLLLGSRHPMFLWWGKDLVQFYNDAYRPSLGSQGAQGAGKHPIALGQTARECWPEVWDYIEYRTNLVMLHGQATWHENQLVPIFRNGRMEDVYWTWSDSPVHDENGNIAGVLVACTETTARVLAERQLQRNREQLQLALEAAELGTWSYNPAQDTFTADAAMLRIFGAAAATGDHDYWQQTLHPDDRLAARQEFAAALAGERNYNLEYRVLHPDGVRWVRSKGRVIEQEDGSKGMFAIVEDITPTKLAQVELQQRVRDLRESQRIGKMGSWRWHLATNTLTWSEEVYRLMDHDPALGVLNYTLHPQIMDEESTRRLERVVARCIAEGRPYEVETKMLLPSTGRTVWFSTRGEAILNAEDKVTELRGTVRDITETKLVEEALRTSEARLQLALEVAELGTWSYDGATDLSTGDAAMQRIFGSSRAAGDFQYWVNFVHPDDREHVRTEFQTAIACDAPYESEYRVVRPIDGEIRWIRSRGRTSKAPGKPVMMSVIVEDITARKLAEDALRSSEERLQLALEAASLGTWTFDETTGLSTGDATMQRIFGSAQAAGDFHYWIQFAHPEDRDAIEADFRKAILGDAAYETEYRIVRPTDGQTRWVRSRGRVVCAPGQPVKMVVVVEDTTNRKHTEAALLRTEKLAAVGRLASSIAHEINNPLEAVTNLVYLAKSNASDPALEQYLSLAEQELQRAAAIASQTLRFHKQSTRPTEATWDDLMGNALGVLTSRIRNAKVTVEQRNRTTRPVLCFDGEIRQVLCNLLINAVDAMYPAAGRLQLRGREGRDHSTGRDGIIFTIADSGTGMPPATLERIFEPFYTTKGPSGTGLGLWISKEIVERHHGRLCVRSCQRRGRSGTVFTLFLPYDAVSR